MSLQQRVPFPKVAIADGAIVKGTCIKFSTDDSFGNLRVTTNAAKETIPEGIALYDVADGGVCEYAGTPGDVVYVKADGAFSKGDKLAVTDANGELDTYSETAGDNSWFVGIALHAAAAAGEMVPIKFAPQETQVED